MLFLIDKKVKKVLKKYEDNDVNRIRSRDKINVLSYLYIVTKRDVL